MVVSKTRFYHIWKGMKQRCFNEKYPKFQHYGGRGITVCGKWIGFAGFQEDMYDGYLKYSIEHTEDNTTLERINVNGNYCKENCCWATWEEQQNNRTNSSGMSFEYSDKEECQALLEQVITAAEWANTCGVSPQYIRRLCVEGKLQARKTAEGVWLIVKPEAKPYKK